MQTSFLKWSFSKTHPIYTGRTLIHLMLGPPHPVSWDPHPDLSQKVSDEVIASAAVISAALEALDTLQFANHHLSRSCHGKAVCDRRAGIF